MHHHHHRPIWTPSLHLRHLRVWMHLHHLLPEWTLRHLHPLAWMHLHHLLPEWTLRHLHPLAWMHLRHLRPMVQHHRHRPEWMRLHPHLHPHPVLNRKLQMKNLKRLASTWVPPPTFSAR
jgi:hypothetical protein